MLKDPIKVKNDIVSWIRNYFAKNGLECTAVIGISGGKDSSTCAALCAEALGKERVLGVLMPNGVQSDIEDSKTLVSFLGIPSLTVNIASGYQGMLSAFSEAFVPSKDAKINLAPRLRMSTLYAIAQSLPKGGRVVNTCNLSEDTIGYSTKFGDAAGDFSPLCHLLVEEVRQIGRALGLPEQLVQKTPSDGLSGMSDEEKIGFSYATLDHYVLSGECLDEEIKKKIERMKAANLHKLLPMPAFNLKKEDR